MKPLRHRPHVYIRKEAISKKQPERATNTGPRRPQARPRGRSCEYSYPFQGSSITSRHWSTPRPPSSPQRFHNFFSFCFERSLAVARTPLTVREQTGWIGRSALPFCSAVGTARPFLRQPVPKCPADAAGLALLGATGDKGGRFKRSAVIGRSPASPAPAIGQRGWRGRVGRPPSLNGGE